MPNQDHADEERRVLGQRLKDAREYLGLSQDEVASALNVRRPSISEIELGQRKVDALELNRFSNLYGRSVHYFLSGTESEALMSDRVGFLSRTFDGLTDQDLQEVARFAEFLRQSRRPTPKKKR